MSTPTATATGTSFPSTGLLDDFNRANGGVGASWSGDTASYAIDGQALKATASDKVIYWNGTSFGANQEAYFKLSTIDSSGEEMGLALKVGESRGTINSAIEVFYSQSGQNVQVWTYASGGQGWVQRGSYPVVLSSGD